MYQQYIQCFSPHTVLSHSFQTITNQVALNNLVSLGKLLFFFVFFHQSIHAVRHHGVPAALLLPNSLPLASSFDPQSSCSIFWVALFLGLQRFFFSSLSHLMWSLMRLFEIVTFLFSRSFSAASLWYQLSTRNGTACFRLVKFSKIFGHCNLNNNYNDQSIFRWVWRKRNEYARSPSLLSGRKVAVVSRAQTSLPCPISVCT